MALLISSPDNEKLKLVRKLRERRWREKLGLFVCEGEDLVAAATVEAVELLVAGENVEPALLAGVSTAAHPPRVIGIYRRADLPGTSRRPATLALWHISDPGNVGTLIRTADAFDAAVALSEGCADPTGAKALRASAGAIWRVPLLPFPDPNDARVARHKDNASAGGESDVQHKSLKRVGLVAHAGAPLGECDLGGEVVFLLGAEREGLPERLGRDLDARIPIGSESLNVAAAGAIALYEWRRQNPVATATAPSP
ncbi:MAG TPA: RNA methyltransferase [Gaiellaceae bacterium]|jgi:TrmH family RNA methyltransferase|nr:RNA methyltransferase [Gaiellaceae bacterium]